MSCWRRSPLRSRCAGPPHLEEQLLHVGLIFSEDRAARCVFRHVDRAARLFSRQARARATREGEPPALGAPVGFVSLSLRGHTSAASCVVPPMVAVGADLRLRHLREQLALCRVAFYVAGGGPCSHAAFDFADLGEELLGIASHIILHAQEAHSADVAAAALATRCRARFPDRVVVLAPEQDRGRASPEPRRLARVHKVCTAGHPDLASASRPRRPPGPDASSCSARCARGARGRLRAAVRLIAGGAPVVPPVTLAFPTGHVACTPRHPERRDGLRRHGARNGRQPDAREAG